MRERAHERLRVFFIEGPRPLASVVFEPFLRESGAFVPRGLGRAHCIGTRKGCTRRIRFVELDDLDGDFSLDARIPGNLYRAEST